jgi:hypothetical protein
MSYAEYLSWVEFRKKHGPLNPILRSDQSRAWNSHILAKLQGAKSLTLKDFLPYTNPEDEVAEATNENVVNAFKAKNSTKVYKRS